MQWNEQLNAPMGNRNPDVVSQDTVDEEMALFQNAQGQLR